jgi:hypothetical protein
VFNSTTLGALGRIELNGLGSDDQITAIRSLAYDSAAKIAIKFKTAWWIEKGGMNKFSGISGTDLPIRVVAYPAWTDNDDPGKPTVLIASYTWHQDATRMGSLINNSAKPCEREALRLVLQDLATMFKSRDPSVDFKFLMAKLKSITDTPGPMTHMLRVPSRSSALASSSIRTLHSSLRSRAQTTISTSLANMRARTIPGSLMLSTAPQHRSTDG